jgi:hypothetical protein
MKELPIEKISEFTEEHRSNFKENIDRMSSDRNTERCRSIIQREKVIWKDSETMEGLFCNVSNKSQ